MEPMYLNIDRRGFLKLSAITAATPILMGSSGILPLSAAMAVTGDSKIFPGVYTDTEKRLLAETDRLMDSLVGWAKVEKFEVDREASMKAYAGFTDPDNPFYTDNAYAEDAGWGELVAVPTYAAKIGVSEYQMPSTEAYPAKSMVLLGEDIDFYRPIRKSDSFRVWNRRPEYKDVTPPSGKGPRTFVIKVSDLDVVNQEGLLVHSYKNYIEQYFWPEKAPDAEPMKEYVYTKEELTRLDELEAGATVRGDAIRYWEEVSVGEKISPVVLGPITDEIISNFTDACMAGISGGYGGAGASRRREGKASGLPSGV